MSYKIGDTVWHAVYGLNQVAKPCPVCFTKKEVVLILGNGDEVKLPCNYCVHGFEAPSGHVKEYEHVAKAHQQTITAVSMETTETGSKYTYRSYNHVLYEDDVFDTEKKALVRSEEKKTKDEKAQITRTEHIKADKKKSFSWNAGYHLRNAKKLRKDAERHDKMATICKERSPQENADVKT